MKNLRIFVAISLLLAAGCNRPEAEDPVTPEKPKGKYELKELTATLPEADTKTELQSDNTVKWSSSDRIAVIDKNGDVHQYKLNRGAGTTIGRFISITTAAEYDNLADLTAIYPACAVASANTASATIRINSDRSGDYATYGIPTWSSGNTDFAFSVNDIKAAKPAGETVNGINFKFTQLGTWCAFMFDFSQSPDFETTYALGEYVTGLTVSSNEGGTPVGISGDATLNLSTLTFSNISETSVNRNISNTPLLESLFYFNIMLYPTVGVNDELLVTLKTNTHTFRFYGKPSAPFQSGSTLKFPITVDKNFTKTGTMLRYTREDKARAKFYYYGTQNCYLLPPATTGDQNQSFVASPHTTDIYYHHQDYDSGNGAPIANGVELLWQDTSGLITTLSYNSGTKTISYTRASGKYGNAVIALKKDSEVLWSYHIWCPEHMPTDLTYTVSGNGEHKSIMSMPLGATQDIHLQLSNASGNLNAFGCYYQWGRKDPLGRSGAYTSQNIERTYYTITNTPTEPFGGDVNGVSPKSVCATDVNATYTGTVATEGNSDYQPKSQFMQNFARANPTTFVYVTDGTFNNNWSLEIDNNFWGNYKAGGTFPRMASTYKSIFDPCPAGYRVPPDDTWLGILTTMQRKSSDAKEWNMPNNGWDGNEFSGNINLDNTYRFQVAKGYTFYYQGIGEGATDFYISGGTRRYSTGKIDNVASDGMYWASATGSNGAARGLHFYGSAVCAIDDNKRAFAVMVRCAKEP